MYKDITCLVSQVFHSANVHQVLCINFPLLHGKSHKFSGLKQDFLFHSVHGSHAWANAAGSLPGAFQGTATVHRVGFPFWRQWGRLC